MSETYTVSAKTVDEAIDLASKLYGGRNKEISHEIVSLPKKGFLGFGSKDAIIRVTVTEAEDVGLSSIVNELKKYKDQPAPESGYTAPEVKAETKQEKQEAKVEKTEVKPQQKKKPQPQPKQEKPEAKAEPKQAKPEAKPQPKAEKPQQKQEKTEAKTEVKSEVKPQQKKKPQPKQEKVEVKAESEAEAPAIANDVKVKVAVSREEMNYAIAFVNTMIGNMNLSAQAIPVSAPEGEEYTTTDTADVYPAINIIGDDTGILIGHHGETLDAIQYLVNLALFRKGSDKGRESIKITVDIENYREKREETLRALARRMAARAVKYKRNVFLEPMNPYERRIIHSELQDYKDVATHSVGSDTNRKIIITYEGSDKAPQNNKRRPRGGKGRQGRQETNVSAGPDVPKGLPLPTLDDVE